MKVQEVKYLSDYNISVKFDDGVTGTVQLNDLVEKGIFKVLQDKSQFAKGLHKWPLNSLVKRT